MKKIQSFQHDFFARNDEKIVKLLSEQGIEGYGLYWIIIEKLYENEGYLKSDYMLLAFDIRTECERIEALINNYGLFKHTKDGRFYSQSILDRLEESKDKSKKAKAAATGRWTEVQNSYIDELIQIFAKEYKKEHGLDYEILWGKDRQAVGALVRMYKRKSTRNTEEAKLDFKMYFQACLKIKDNWYKEHMSLSLIVSKINEINLMLKREVDGNGTSKIRTGASKQDVVRIAYERFGDKQQSD